MNVSMTTISYRELFQTEVMNEKVKDAFGENGLGALLVTDIPNELIELKDKLYRLGLEIGQWPESKLEKLSDPDSFYSFGWSKGREKLEGVADHRKGSYYANPLDDCPTTDQESIKKYPSFLSPNIWPDEDLPDFKHTFKQLGSGLVSIALEVIKGCDAYVKKQNNLYEKDRLYRLLTEARSYKARLLHYYPVVSQNTNSSSDFKESKMQPSNWCGWHNDHGVITVLLPASYFDKEGNEVEYKGSSGLYIQTRSNESYHVKCPKNGLICQIGETSQILTGGILQATPHAVYGAQDEGLRRISFANFANIGIEEKMTIPAGKSEWDVLNTASLKNLPKGVPHLSQRWNQQMSYAEFSESTYKAYY